MAHRSSPGRAAAALALGGLLHTACGGGGSPSGPSTPAPPSVPTWSVTATVFHDENENGVLDPSEVVRVPNVEVVIGTGSGRSAPGTGQASVAGIQEGSFPVSVKTESLPAYFVPFLPGVPVAVPGTNEVRVALTLPIGRNNPGIYLGFGDSITYGEGSTDGNGYIVRLQNLLAPHFGWAELRKLGRPGQNSAEGLTRIRVWLRTFRPAYVLILHGTNDWQNQTCQNGGPDACFTLSSLEGMIDVAEEEEVLPVLATLLPVNPSKAPAGRNTWIDDTNARIKALAQRRQVLLADLNAEMKAGGNLAGLFVDDVHPNDAGYQVVAQGWFKAISRSRSAAGSARSFGFRVP